MTSPVSIPIADGGPGAEITCELPPLTRSSDEDHASAVHGLHDQQSSVLRCAAPLTGPELQTEFDASCGLARR